MLDTPTTGPSTSYRRERTGAGGDSDRILAEMWPAVHHDLLRYVSSLTAGDAHAAEDVVQETWIRLWQHRETLEDGLPLLGWLRTVARNIVVDRFRRRRARPTEVALAPDVQGCAPDEVDQVDARETVEHTLSTLSPRHRAVVREVYVRDRPVAEVASDLGIPVGTVKSRCHTALHQLRASLGRGATGPTTGLVRS